MFRQTRKAVSIVILAAFIITSIKSPAYSSTPLTTSADTVLSLPALGTMVNLSPEFTPAHLKGMIIHPQDAFKFDFIVYKGDRELTGEQKKEEYTKLIKYFLASLAVPDDDQWVNLSPYEKDRIIKDDFGKTLMGRDLLAQDYILKQITASLIYPEENLGKKFWDKVYAQAREQYGTTNIPVNTFNKVWIVPDEGIVYENGNTAYILKSHLKVMLEEDYLALSKHQRQPGDMFEKRGHVPREAGYVSPFPMNALLATHTVASKIIREIILPALEKEVNEGANFARLRQIFSSMLLATWYKKALRESLLGKVYADKAKVQGVDQKDPKANEAIYQQYLAAFKKGVYNYIKEDVDKFTHQSIPRKYFSGGMRNPGVKGMTVIDLVQLTKHPDWARAAIREADAGEDEEVTGDFAQAAPDAAMDTAIPLREGRPASGDFLLRGNVGTHTDFTEGHEVLAFPEDIGDDTEGTLTAFKDGIYRFFKEVVKPLGAKIDSGDVKVDQRYDGKPSLIEELGKLGLLGMAVPAPYGENHVRKIIKTLADAFSWYANGSVGSLVRVHGGVGTLPILLYGTEEQKEKYLPKLSTGEWIGAYALTEPGHGSDALNAVTPLGTKAVLKERNGVMEWHITGTKIFLTNAGFADVFTVLAMTDQDSKYHKKSFFILEKNDGGISIIREEKKLGLHGSSTAQVAIDVWVPEDRLLGKRGEGDAMGRSILNHGRTSVAAGSWGGSKRVFEEALKYAIERVQFHVPLADWGKVQGKLADMEAQIYALESVAYAVSSLFDSAPVDKPMEPALEASSAKVWASELFNRIAFNATQLFGGTGFMMDNVVTRFYADARVMTLFEGATDVLTSQVIAERALSLYETNLKPKGLHLLQGLNDLPSDHPLHDVVKATKEVALTVEKTAIVLNERGGMKLLKDSKANQSYLAAFGQMVAELFALSTTVSRTLHRIDDRKMPSEHEIDMTRLYALEAIAKIQAEAGKILESEDFKSVKYDPSSDFRPFKQIEIQQRIARYAIEAYRQAHHDRAQTVIVPYIAPLEFTVTESLVKLWIKANNTGMEVYFKDKIVPGPVIVNRVLSWLSKELPDTVRLSHYLKYSNSIRQGETVIFSTPKISDQNAQWTQLTIDVFVKRKGENIPAVKISVWVRSKTNEERALVPSLYQEAQALGNVEQEMLAWGQDAQQLEEPAVIRKNEIGDNIVVSQRITPELLKATVAEATPSQAIPDIIAGNMIARVITSLFPTGHVGVTLSNGKLETPIQLGDVLTAKIIVENKFKTKTSRRRYELKIFVTNQDGHEVMQGSIEMLSRRQDRAMTQNPLTSSQAAFNAAYQLGYFGPVNDQSISEVDAQQFSRQIGVPGAFPFTRGIFPSITGRKGGQTPTVRKYASFGTPEDSNKLLKDQLARGATGLSIAFDLPTQNGYDSDHLMSAGEVGKVGVSINTLDDMRTLFDGIDLINKKGDGLSVSMTINATSPILLAMYYLVAKEKGLKDEQIRGTIQNDVLKEYTARGTYVFPYAGTMRLTSDIFKWTREVMPKYNTINVCGYHNREKGANEVQEIAFTISNALQYLIEAKKRGLSQDELAGIMGQVAFFMNLKKQTFVEVAKYRALRRVWATLVRDAFRISDKRAQMVRVQSWAGGSDVRFSKKVHLNIVRNAIRMLNAFAAGPNGVDGAGFDESIGIPPEFSQGLVIDGHFVAVGETGLAEVTDHMGGSYLLEAETDRIEQEVWEELARISHEDDYKVVLHNMVSDIERQAAKEQAEIDKGNIPIVGVNTDLKGSEFFPTVERQSNVSKSYDAKQQERLAKIKKTRNNESVSKALDDLETAAEGKDNLMPFIVEAVRINATVGEISDRLRRVFGVSDKEPWNARAWVDSNGTPWEPMGQDKTPEVFDQTVRNFIITKAGLIGKSADKTYQRGVARGYFEASDMPYVKEAGTQEIPGHFPFTRGVAANLSKPEHFEDINGYAVREMGGDVVQELAYSLLVALKKIESQEGQEQEAYANQIRLVLSSGDKFYEEIAKFRVARRLWAKLLREHGINDPNAQQLVLKAKTAFYTSTEKKFWLNIQRAALQAYQAYLGGAQEIEVTPFDSPYGETEHSALAGQMALDTVAIIKKELGLEGIADPLGGSFLLEATTDDLETKVSKELEKLMELSGQKGAYQELLAPPRSSPGALAVIGDPTKGRYPWVTQELFDRVNEEMAGSLERQRAQVTAGLLPKVGENVFLKGGHPQPRVRRASQDHLLAVREPNIEDLSSPDKQVRLVAVNGWFKKAEQLSQEVRAALGVNNQFSGASKLVNGLYTAILHVNKDQLERIKTVWDISDQEIVLTTPQGARLKIVEGQENEIGSLGIELASNDIGSAMRLIDQKAHRTPWADGPLKILIAKPGFDGHDTGAKIVVDALEKAGFTVDYTGIKQTPEAIVQAAKDNKADVIGLSILSGAHNTHVPAIAKLLIDNRLNDVLMTLGGVIPQEDQEALLTQSGVGQIYPGGTPLDKIISDLRAWQKWLATENTIKIKPGNQFAITLPDGKTVNVALNETELPQIEGKVETLEEKEPTTALAIPKRGLLSGIPKIEGLWSHFLRTRELTAQHFALAGDMLIEAVLRNPVLKQHIVPFSDSIRPHDQYASVASAGLAVTREHFEKIRQLNGNPPLSKVPPDIGADETELEVAMPDGSHRILDILADTTDSLKQTLSRHIKNNGEGIQQVEVWTDDVGAAAKAILEALKDRSNGLTKVSEAPREGANGTKIFFVLVTVENNIRVLVELIQRPSADRALLAAPGGINFNSKFFDLHIKRDRNGVPLSMQYQDIQNIHINGLIPVITNIIPVTNMPSLLGMSEGKT